MNIQNRLSLIYSLIKRKNSVLIFQHELLHFFTLVEPSANPLSIMNQIKDNNFYIYKYKKIQRRIHLSGLKLTNNYYETYTLLLNR